MSVGDVGLLSGEGEGNRKNSLWMELLVDEEPAECPGGQDARGILGALGRTFFVPTPFLVAFCK